MLVNGGKLRVRSKKAQGLGQRYLVDLGGFLQIDLDSKKQLKIIGFPGGPLCKTSRKFGMFDHGGCVWPVQLAGAPVHRGQP